LVLAHILEYRLKLFFDAVVDVVFEDGERAFLLVIDIVGIFAAVIVARGLRFLFARPQDDPAKRNERVQGVHEKPRIIARSTRAAVSGSSR
jgi:hypothetical protein